MRWHVAVTEHRREFLAWSEIGRAGFRAHLPLYLSRKRGHLPKILPLFPGYLFVAFDRQRDPWGKLRTTRGVADLLMTGPEQPAQVPVGDVEALMARGRVGDGVIDPRVVPPAWAGRKVRLLTGPFESFEGLCDAADQDRVHVLLDLFGRQTPVWVSTADVTLIA